jgi:hypothetical protein
MSTWEVAKSELPSSAIVGAPGGPTTSMQTNTAPSNWQEEHCGANSQKHQARRLGHNVKNDIGTRRDAVV